METPLSRYANGDIKNRDCHAQLYTRGNAESSRIAMRRRKTQQGGGILDS